MSILKNVVNKIAESDRRTELASQKVELAKERIELSLTADAKKILSKLDKDNNNMKKAISNIEKETAKVEGILDKLYTSIDDLYTKSMDVYRDSKADEEARDIYFKLEASAKDLGLNIKDLPIAKQLEDAVKRNESTYDDVLGEIEFSRKALK